MNSADVVVVPSHHSYPEGLPFAIIESLMVQTPVIASDHPMFLGRIGNRGAVQFFKEKNARDLARKILLLCSDDKKYKDACINTALEWKDLIIDLKFADLINSWIQAPDSVRFQRIYFTQLHSQQK